MAVREMTARAGVITLAVLAIGACAKKENYAADTTAASSTMTAIDTGMVSATSSAPTGLSDANIAWILDAANLSDSTWGAIAATKGTSAQVRDFGKRMVRDHHALRIQGLDLAKKLSITPAPAADDSSVAVLRHANDMLNNTPKGNDFDKAYIDHEIDYHKTVLQAATTAMSAAQNAELKNLIQKAAPLIQAHLDLAEKIQKGMK
jgi:putative membrane protein